MDVLDEEVFAVIIALAIVGSALGIAQVLRPEVTEPFIALGILDSECRIGNYPKVVFGGEDIRLCIYLYNHLGHPQLMMVKYKLGSRDTLPTNTSESPELTIKSFKFLLNHASNITKPIVVPIPTSKELIGMDIALIFELWLYDGSLGDWVYSGRWVHLYVKVREGPIP